MQIIIIELIDIMMIAVAILSVIVFVMSKIVKHIDKNVYQNCNAMQYAYRLLMPAVIVWLLAHILVLL